MTDTVKLVGHPEWWGEEVGCLGGGMVESWGGEMVERWSVRVAGCKEWCFFMRDSK